MDNINLDMIGRWINDGKSHLVLIACIHVSVCRRLLLVYAPREAHDVVPGMLNWPPNICNTQQTNLLFDNMVSKQIYLRIYLLLIQYSRRVKSTSTSAELVQNNFFQPIYLDNIHKFNATATTPIISIVD